MPGVEGVAYQHRRRRSSALVYGNGQEEELSTVEHHRRRPRHKKVEDEDETYGSEDGHSSGSVSPNGEVEHDNQPSDDGITDDEETGLTSEHKAERRRRRQSVVTVDARIAGTSKVTKTEQTLADRSVLRASLVNALLIGLWYLFSLSISIYNKWMFSPDHLDFHYPLFTTCMHMLVQFSLASLVLLLIPKFRPEPQNMPPSHGYTSVDPDSKQAEKALMTNTYYITRIGPCGAATGLDIGLGNTSLKFITLTFYTMCKSSSLAFVLLFAFLFRLEAVSIKLILIITIMIAGVVMMVAGETAFNALGFILVISAAFFSGFRWALTQILLLKNPATSNPFSSIFYLAPIMFISLAIIAIPAEGFGAFLEGLKILTEDKGPLQGIGIILLPGVLAFLMTSSEFALLQRTSVVTLSICGIFKEVVTISAASIVFHDPLTPINISGLAVTIASIAAYNYLKIRKMRKEAHVQVHNHMDDGANDRIAMMNGQGDVGGMSTSFHGPRSADERVQNRDAGADHVPNLASGETDDGAKVNDR